MLFFGEPGALSEELEVCFGELELTEETFYFFVGLRLFFREYEDTEGMKNEEEKFLI